MLSVVCRVVLRVSLATRSYYAGGLKCNRYVYKVLALIAHSRHSQILIKPNNTG